MSLKKDRTKTNSQKKEELPEEQAPNLLDMCPVPSIKWEQAEDGLITLFTPRFSNKWMVKHILPRMKHQDLKIHLDEFGSWVWQQIDGHTTVFQIAKNLQEKFGESVEPVYDRLGLFINHLARRQFITLTNDEH